MNARPVFSARDSDPEMVESSHVSIAVRLSGKTPVVLKADMDGHGFVPCPVLNSYCVTTFPGFRLIYR